MASIIQKPDYYSFLGNLKKVIIESSTTVIVALCRSGEDIFTMKYEAPASGKITVTLDDVIKSNIDFSLPDSSQVITSDIPSYQFKVDNIEAFSFYVVPGGIAGTGTAETFITYNFLTWQSQKKEIHWNVPNWLRYACILDGCKLMIKAYHTDKTDTEIVYTELSKHKLYTFNMNFATIASKFTKQPVYFDVWIQQEDLIISYLQRYILTNKRELYLDYFIFENTLGGIDTIPFTGEKKLLPEVEAKQAEFDEETFDYEIDYKNVYEKHTGYFDNKLLQTWVSEFFRSTNRFHFVTDEDSTLKRITIAEAEFKIIPFEPNSLSFEFTYSKQDKYFNLSRIDELGEQLEIAAPDDPVFIIAPRLSEFPLADVGADPIIPVQHPFENTWRQLPLSAIIESIRKVSVHGTNYFHYTNTFPPTVSPQSIRLLAIEHNFTSSPDNRKWQYQYEEHWSTIPGQSESVLEIKPDDDIWHLNNSLTIRYIANDRYSDTITITKVRDGGDSFNVVILSENGTTFPDGEVDTVLHAIVYQAGENITDKIASENINWTRKSDDSDSDEIWNKQQRTGKHLPLSSDDVPTDTTSFICEILN